MTETYAEASPPLHDFVKQCLTPFAPNVIGKLPRVTCPDCSDKNKNCANHARGRCAECMQHISTAHIHIDFVGHAPLTARLLELDPLWHWEPMAYAPDGSPLIKERGKQSTMWINLTIRGITRPGVGIAPTSKEELEKELIGDALRNAAMRFGLALDLWAKGDLIGEYGEDVVTKADDAQAPKPAGAPQEPAGRPAAKKAAKAQPAAKKAATPPPRPAPAPPAAEGPEDPAKLFKKIPKERRQSAMAALADNPFDSDAGPIALWPFPEVGRVRGEDGELVDAETIGLALQDAASTLRTWAAEEGVEL